MSGNALDSKPTYFVAALIIIALAMIAYTLFLRPAPDDKQPPIKNIGAVANQLDTLLANYSKQPIINHLAQLIDNNDWQMIATELAILRHGKTTDTPAFDHLSESTNEKSDVKDFQNATRLGKWLGAIRIILERSRFNANTDTQRLGVLLTGLATATNTTSINYTQDFLDITSSVQTNNASLTSAIELIGYSEVTQTDITTPINNAIEKVLREQE
ncbi:MAG: hypothetical protein V3U65_13420 [Granulosicoccaceae bacterium]